MFFCLSRLVEVTCYGSQTSLYDLETAVPSVLKPDLIDVWVSRLKFPPNLWQQAVGEKCWLQMRRLNCCNISCSLQLHWQHKRGTKCVRRSDKNKNHWETVPSVSTMSHYTLFIAVRVTDFHIYVTEHFYFRDWQTSHSSLRWDVSVLLRNSWQVKLILF